VDPGETLREYRTTRFPDRFYNLKIGIPWADLERRLDVMTVLSLCSDEPMEEKAREWGTYSMGVDTGSELHVVILRTEHAEDGIEPTGRQHVVYLGTCHAFEDLDELMKRFRIYKCVIDGLPETHPTRAFAQRHRGRVFMNFFNEHQRGEAKWDREALSVFINRTEALDASRAAVRDKKLVLPRRLPIVETFARHMASDAKVLEEDEETGAKRFKYVRTGADHYSLAFTYAWMASLSAGGPRVRVLNLAPRDSQRPLWPGVFSSIHRRHEIDAGFLFREAQQVVIAAGGRRRYNHWAHESRRGAPCSTASSACAFWSWPRERHLGSYQGSVPLEMRRHRRLTVVGGS
jgi:hypothetical protein